MGQAVMWSFSRQRVYVCKSEDLLEVLHTGAWSSDKYFLLPKASVL